MKYCFYFLCLGFFLLSTLSVAQKPSFSFSDTYPTNNVDSLEQWLKSHPKPTDERLKNLIRLKRTYFFEYPERKDRDTLEMRQLSQRLNQPVGKIIIKVWGSKAFKVHLQAFKDFEALKDTSGMIYTLSGLASSNYNINGLEQGDKYGAKDFLMKAKQLLKARFDAHDYFILERAMMLYQNSPTENDLAATLVSLRKALALSESNPQYQYIRLTIKALIGTTYSFREEYTASYATYKEILAQLKPDQINLTILLSLNLASDCDELGYYDEKLALCEKIAFLLRRYPENKTSYLSLGLYESFKNEMDRRGRYKEASAYGDSISVIKDIIYEKERKQKLIEFQSENKQKQIAELNRQQLETVNRNRLITFFLMVVLILAAAFGYLGWRLWQSNASLNALVQLRDEFIRIIAHDLRHPLHAFYGLSEVFSKLIQRGDQQTIVKLSQSIDQSGLSIRQMLDNLMYWALSQKGGVAINPTTFALQPQIEALVSVYGAVADIKKIQLIYDCPLNQMVHTDVNALDLILRNLIDNAIQHTPNGKIYISAISSNDPLQAIIRIRDDGNGMTKAQLELVREVLANPKSFQPKQKNLGLGLIIVSTFARQSRIEIGVESLENEGTTFQLKV